MKTEFLKGWALKLNVTEEKLAEKFELAKKEMKSIFPDQTEETIFEKAKMQIKVDYKRQFLSSAVSFVGIVIGSETPRDPLKIIRKNQLDRYSKAKEQADVTGDQNIVQKEIDNNVIRINEKDGKVIPLWPKFKNNGKPSKVAGNDMPPESESTIQTVYGVGTKLGEDKARGFILELKGDACGQPLKEGKIVSFRALNKTQPSDVTYKLSTNRTEFIETENEYLQEGLNKIGLPGMITSFFKNNVITWEDIKGWVSDKTENLNKDVIPEKFTKGFVILVDSLCVYQNFIVDKKERIKINICSTDDEADDITVLCLANKNLEGSIDFATNSKVITIGRPWLPKPREEDEIPNLLLMASGMFAYSDWKIPRINDVKPLTESNVISPQEPPTKTESAPLVKEEESAKEESAKEEEPQKEKKEEW